MCLLVRVAMVDKNKAVVCCLLATSAIMLSEKKKRKRKIWSKKWHLKRNVSWVARLLNEWLEKDVEDYINYLRTNEQTFKLWYSLIELRSFLCERRLERTVLRPALLPMKLCNLLSFSVRYDVTHKIAQFDWECIASLRAQYEVNKSSWSSSVFTVLHGALNLDGLFWMKIKLKSGIIFGFWNIRVFCLAGLLGIVKGESHILLILLGIKIVTQVEGTYCCIWVEQGRTF